MSSPPNNRMLPSDVERFARWSYRSARRIAVAVVGGTLVLLGVLLIFLPGPAFVVIPAGLAVLALEFHWARRWLQRARELGNAALSRRGSQNEKGEERT